MLLILLIKYKKYYLIKQNIAERQVQVWINSESHNFTLQSYHLYDELITYINTINGIPNVYFIAVLDENDIPKRKITSNQDLLSVLNNSENKCNFAVVSSEIQCYDFIYGDTYSDDITNKIEGKQLNGMLGDLAAIKNNASKQINNEVINFFIGLTGGGKSTLVNHCQGIKLECNKVKGKFQIFPIIPQYLENVKVAQIGNQSQSCTSLPGYYKTISGQIICDLAGFIDTKGMKQEIRNSFSNRQIFKMGSLIRIIIILDQYSLTSGRGRPFVQTLVRIRSLFPSTINSHIKYCSGIIVTKVDSDFTKQDIVLQIKSVCEENGTLNEVEKQYLNSIIDNNRIAIFRNPKKIQQSYYQIQEEDNILNFIDQIPIAALESDAQISLSENAKLQIRKIMANIQDIIANQCDQLTLFYPPHFHENNYEILSKYCTNIDEAIMKIKTLFPYDIDQLVSACRILGLQINYEEFQRKVGSLIKNLRRCDQVYNLFDNFLAFLSHKQKVLLLRISNTFDGQQVKQISKEYAQKQQNLYKQIQQKKKKIMNSMNQQAQKDRERVRMQIIQFNKKIQQMNVQHQQQLARLRKK